MTFSVKEKTLALRGIGSGSRSAKTSLLLNFKAQYLGEYLEADLFVSLKKTVLITELNIA